MFYIFFSSFNLSNTLAPFYPPKAKPLCYKAIILLVIILYFRSKCCFQDTLPDITVNRDFLIRRNSQGKNCLNYLIYSNI